MSTQAEINKRYRRWELVFDRARYLKSTRQIVYTATATAAFWEAWKADKQAVRDAGYQPWQNGCRWVIEVGEAVPDDCGVSHSGQWVEALPPRAPPEPIQLDCIEDIEHIFRTGRLVEITAILHEPQLQHIWRTPEGERALAVLRECIGRPMMIDRAVAVAERRTKTEALRAEVRDKLARGEPLSKSRRRFLARGERLDKWGRP
jgi:hypothetical protein